MLKRRRDPHISGAHPAAGLPGDFRPGHPSGQGQPANDGHSTKIKKAPKPGLAVMAMAIARRVPVQVRQVKSMPAKFIIQPLSGQSKAIGSYGGMARLSGNNFFDGMLRG